MLGLEAPVASAPVGRRPLVLGRGAARLGDRSLGDRRGDRLRRDAPDQIRGALSDLPNDQSRVIQLAYFGGFTHTEIADMLDAPVGTVKGRMRLGLKKMKAQLGEGQVAV